MKPVRHVVVTVADRVADADGLWPVDFTLLSTVPSLEQVDVVATEAMLAAGLLERIHAALPGLEEMSGSRAYSTVSPAVVHPRLVVPDVEGAVTFQARDREDELAHVARRIKAARRGGDDTPLHKHALVVRRPLPYLYLARSVFGGAGLPFETLDTLPLAAEPYAAALDLVLDCIVSGFSRSATIALLRSPHFQFDDVADGLPARIGIGLRPGAGGCAISGRHRSARATGGRLERDRRASQPRRTKAAARGAGGAGGPRGGTRAGRAGRVAPGDDADGHAPRLPLASSSRAG